MAQIDNLYEKVNNFLRENNFPVLSEKPDDMVILFKNALKNIWVVQKNAKKRDKIAHDISSILSQFLGGKNTSEIMTKIIEELDNIIPAEGDFVEIYNFCLDEYEDFLNNFIKSNSLEIEKLENIIKKLLIIIRKSKNALLSYFTSNEEQYNYNVCHGINSTILALIGGEELKFTEKQLRELGFVGLLHDIGMLKIPDSIINKEDKLTEEEYNQIKTHPVLAYKLINEKNIFGKDILDPIIQHHEMYDGQGYPRKLSGEKIHIYARIIAIADAYEAQISHRAYRKTKSGYSAMKEVLSLAQNKFDPKVLRAFLSSISIYPPGTIVQLNNNAIGTVTAINSNAPLRPTIKILIDEFGEKPEKQTIIDLKDHQNLFIIKVLNKEDIMK